MANDLHKLKKELQKTHDFPLKYMYKFIVPAGEEHQLKVLFEDAEVSLRPSKNGNYISFTAIRIELTADSIVQCYENLPVINGLISL
jgi:hypothetical protein